MSTWCAVPLTLLVTDSILWWQTNIVDVFLGIQLGISDQCFVSCVLRVELSVYCLIVNEKMSGDPCAPQPPAHPWNLHISIYIVPNILISPNLMIIITGTFSNTSIPLKLYEITLFPQVHQSFIPFMKAMSYHYADEVWASNEWDGLNFHRRDLKVSDIVPNTITNMNKNENEYAKIDTIPFSCCRFGWCKPFGAVLLNMPFRIHWAACTTLDAICHDLVKFPLKSW